MHDERGVRFCKVEDFFVLFSLYIIEINDINLYNYSLIREVEDLEGMLDDLDCNLRWKKETMWKSLKKYDFSMLISI